MIIDEIKVNTVRLKNDANEILSLIENMEKNLSEMQSLVNQMNQMWEGDTKKVFERSFYDDMQDAQVLLKELANIQSYETNASARYDKCEQKVADMIKSIQI